MTAIKYHRAKYQNKSKYKQSSKEIISPNTTPTIINPSRTTPPSLYPNLRWKLTKSEKAWSWVPFIGIVQAAKKACFCKHDSASLEASYLLKNQACSLTILGGAAVLGPPALVTVFGVSICNATISSSKRISKMKLKKYKQRFLANIRTSRKSDENQLIERNI